MVTDQRYFTFAQVDRTHAIGGIRDDMAIVHNIAEP